MKAIIIISYIIMGASSISVGKYFYDSVSYKNKSQNELNQRIKIHNNLNEINANLKFINKKIEFKKLNPLDSIFIKKYIKSIQKDTQIAMIKSQAQPPYHLGPLPDSLKNKVHYGPPKLKILYWKDINDVLEQVQKIQNDKIDYKLNIVIGFYEEGNMNEKALDLASGIFYANFYNLSFRTIRKPKKIPTGNSINVYATNEKGKIFIDIVK